MPAWPRSAPCRAQEGSEWCMLCQLSPNETRARGHRFVARSWRRVANGRLPNTWHREFTLQVTCCSTATRTSPAHSSAARAVRQVPPISHPAPDGRARESAQGGKRGRDGPHGGIGQHVRGVPRGRGGVVAQQPARVGVREPAELPSHAGAVAVRGVRVTGPVGEGVVAAVDGDPADDLTLEAHRSRDRKRDPQRRDRGEAAVRQQPVKAHGHPEPGDHVEGHREQDVGQIQAMTPGQPGRCSQPGERHHHERGRHPSPDPALDRARRPAIARERRRPVVVSHRKPRRHRGCSAWSHSGSRSWQTRRSPARSCRRANYRFRCFAGLLGQLN
jgi:hypothetical protein